MSLLEQLIEDIKDNNVINPEKMIEIIETLPKEHFKYLDRYRQLLKIRELRLKDEFLKEILIKLDMTQKIEYDEEFKIGDIIICVIDMGREMDSFIFKMKINQIFNLKGRREGNFIFLVDNDFNNIIKKIDGWLSYTEFIKSVGNTNGKFTLYDDNRTFMLETNHGLIQLYKKST